MHKERPSYRYFSKISITKVEESKSMEGRVTNDVTKSDVASNVANDVNDVADFTNVTNFNNVTNFTKVSSGNDVTDVGIGSDVGMGSRGRADRPERLARGGRL